MTLVDHEDGREKPTKIEKRNAEKQKFLVDCAGLVKQSQVEKTEDALTV
jgi:hypothetical protein